MSKQPRTIEVFPHWWPYLSTMLFGIILIKKGRTLTEVQLRHEMIHYEQQRELAFILFFPVYWIEFIVRFLFTWNWRKTYRNVSFEQEAYQHDEDSKYLGREGTRQPYAWRSIQVEDRKYWWSRNQGFVFAAMMVWGFSLAWLWNVKSNQERNKDNKERMQIAATNTMENLKQRARSKSKSNYDTTTVSWIYNHYQRNAINADDIFRDQQLIIQGRIKDISEALGSYVVTLEDQTGRALVYCYFPLKKRSELTSLATGHWVHIGGTCKGAVVIPIMKECWIH